MRARRPSSAILRRAHVLAFEPADKTGFQRIAVFAPQAELRNYVTDLRTLAQGLGTYVWRHERFEAAPARVSQSLREAVTA